MSRARPKPDCFVLDTSLFVNPDTQREFAPDREEAVRRFLRIAAQHGLELFMPSSIFRELSHFADTESLKAFRRQCTVRGPDLYGIQVPAAILHSFVGDLRNRVNKGLRIAEEAIRSEYTETNIKKVRQQYRSALRGGIVDSVEDLDVVLMAKEIGGGILSADNGIMSMAETLGIEVFTAKEFLYRFAGSEEGAENGQ